MSFMNTFIFFYVNFNPLCIESPVIFQPFLSQFAIVALWEANDLGRNFYEFAWMQSLDCCTNEEFRIDFSVLVFRSVRNVMFNVEALAAIWNCWHLFKQKEGNIFEVQVVMYLCILYDSLLWRSPSPQAWQAGLCTSVHECVSLWFLILHVQSFEWLCVSPEPGVYVPTSGSALYRFRRSRISPTLDLFK